MLRMFFVGFLIVVGAFANSGLAHSESNKFTDPTIISYVSKLDGTVQRAYFAATGNDDKPKPLIIHLHPPVPEDDHMAFAYARRALRAAGESAAYLRPLGRGGTVFQDVGEIDVFEALAAAQRRIKIDPTRISLYGTSMGGAGALYLASHYPDQFSAVAAVAGYSDYQLWKKPGYIFKSSPWEEFSWRSRSATYLVENLRESGLWLLHGEWDRNSPAGGVGVEQSLQLAQELKKVGIPYEVSILPGIGHEVTLVTLPFGPARRYDEKVMAWLIQKRLQRAPNTVEFKTYSMRHNRNAWLRINQFVDYGKADRPAHLQAAYDAQDNLRIATENVAHMTVGPIPDQKLRSLFVDGNDLGQVNIAHEVHVERKTGEAWKVVQALPAAGEKQFDNSGPIGDVFFEPTIFVRGTQGNPEENYFNREVSADVSGFLQYNNGGVNRGEMTGTQNIRLLQKKDSDLSSADKRDFNLALFGNPETNSVFAEFKDQIPVKFGKDEITVGTKTYKGADVAIVAIFPNPKNNKRYLLIHGGVSPDAATWGSNLNLSLLPDFIVYNRDKVLDWGFFNNRWRF